MDPLHARYPFLDAARGAVREADVDLAGAIERGGPVVDRARDRVRAAIEDGRIGEPARSPLTELLSYPVARVLVSLVDEPGLTRRYAHAEAATAHDRFTADVEADVELRSVDRQAITLERLLREFDLDVTVRRREPPSDRRPAGRFRFDVGRYLALAGSLDGERWRLVNRPLADGRVHVTRKELYELLREAIRARVEADLPLSVPDEIADALAPAVDDVRERLADLDLPRPDVVEPDLFPPCMKALRERAAAGDDLAPHSRFVLSSFLATIGMDTDEIVSAFDDDRAVREGVAYLRSDDGIEYPPPSCATMQAYGDCVNKDSLCETIAHPLEYYDERLDGAATDQFSRPESQ